MPTIKLTFKLELFKPICSSIDKLDKKDWSYVEKDMLCKGLSKESVDMLKNTINLITTQTKNSFCFNSIAFLSEKAKDELFLLKTNLANRLSGAWEKNFQFDISLARGLDYYTSLIFEVVVPKEKGKQTIGSIAGGGRYDKLCGVGCVGFSLGKILYFTIVV